MLPDFVTKLFSKETLLDIGMNKRQSEIYTKKFDKLIMNKVKVPSFNCLYDFINVLLGSPVFNRNALNLI